MKIRTLDDISIIAPHGWLMGGPETDDLSKTIRGLLESGNRRLLIDLCGVTHMNSTALGVLVECHKSYEKLQGSVKLCNLVNRIQNAIVVTKLSLVFDVYVSERAALASFAAGQTAE